MDARAPNAEEGRGQLRKAAGSRKQTEIRRYPNGETQLRIAQLPPHEYIVRMEGTRGTETSKYPEEKKETSISKVAASEMERAQTGEHAHRGCGSAESGPEVSRRALESAARGSKSLVGEDGRERAETRVPQDTGNPAGSRGDHLPRLNTNW